MLANVTPNRGVVGGAVLLVVICLSEALPLCYAQGDRGRVSPVHSDPQRTAEFVRVRAKVLAEGSAPVIVELDVPNVNALLVKSRSAKNLLAAKRTDGQLAAAIDIVTQRELLKLAGTEHRVHRTYDVVPFVALQVSKAALDLLEASAAVLGIQEDHLSAPSLDTTIALIGADTTWNIGYDGTGWYVAILDTGLRDTHQFFAGKNIVQACFARGQDGTTGAGDCPNGLSSDISSAHPAQHHTTNPRSSHGTHVAGIAVGNGPGVPEGGVAKGADLIAIQVFSQFFGACNGQDCVLTWGSDQISALNFLFSSRFTYNIASANMSLGGGEYANEAICDAANAAVKVSIDNLRSAGIATVIASGNDGFCGSMGGPGCISTAIAVGATNDLDLEAGFSNYDGAMLEIYAPGVNILSSVFNSDTSYQSGWSGTSMATPHVAGAWAVLKQAAPEAGVQTILDAIQSSAVTVTGRSNCNPTPPDGRIQLDAAFEALVPAIRNCGLGKLTSAGASAGDQFGFAVDLDGDVAVIGSRLADCAAGSQCGAAFVYRWDDVSLAWSQEDEFVPPTPGSAVDRFGSAVAVGGDFAAVSTPFDDHGVLTDAGSVSLYEWDGLAWGFSQQLIAPDADDKDLFGISVAIDGAVAVIGASNEGNTGLFDGVGAAYFYAYDGASWGFVQKVIPAGALSSDVFGWSVSISGDVAVVGSLFADCAAGDGCGAVFVYRWDGTNWVEEQKLQDATAATFDTFGRSVSIRGNVIMVGADGVDCAAGIDCGAVYVYTWDGSTWVFKAELTPDGAQESDWFGQSVSFGGSIGVGGAPGRDCAAGDQCGAAYGIRLGTSGWFVDGGPFVVPDPDAFDLYGGAVASDGLLILAGARGDDPLATGDTGAVYASALDSDCNMNRQTDFCDIRDGISQDVNSDGVPDECGEVFAALTDTLGPKPRYLSIKPGNGGRRVAIRVEFVSLPDPHGGAVGRRMWLGAPDEFSENAGKTDPADAPGSPTMWASTLQCDPFYDDWGSIEMVYVYDASIVSDAQYSVQILEELADAGVEGNYTVPLVLDTSIWGDIISNCATTPCGPPDGSIDVTTDVTAVLNKFKNLPGAPIKARSDLDHNVPDLLINISDVTHAMNAFGGFDYPFSGPPAVDPCL